MSACTGSQEIDSGLDPLQRTLLMLEALPNSPAGGRVCEGRPRRRLAANRCGRLASIGCERCCACRETQKGEARAGNTRGERGKEVCIRASDTRCAGMPNLGSSGLEREDFLPRLCASMCPVFNDPAINGERVDGLADLTPRLLGLL